MSECEPPKVVIRPATAADIEAFTDMPDKPTLRAWCMEVDGEIIALGGCALVRGRWLGFIDLTAQARQFKMHIMRAAKRYLDDARRQGVKFIFVEVDPNEPRALAWLSSLGFELDQRSQHLFRWKA